MLISPSPINTIKQLAAVMRKQRSTVSIAPTLAPVSLKRNLADTSMTVYIKG
jgi:hypothetical protein